MTNRLTSSRCTCDKFRNETSFQNQITTEKLLRYMIPYLTQMRSGARNTLHYYIKIALQASRQERTATKPQKIINFHISHNKKKLQNAAWNDVLFVENTSRNTIDGV